MLLDPVTYVRCETGVSHDRCEIVTIIVCMSHDMELLLDPVTYMSGVSHGRCEIVTSVSHDMRDAHDCLSL